jgi:pyruvate/2-oxoglutarate dehydrogenase complex dihydrolipoamide dehydrogenase (E3) component
VWKEYLPDFESNLEDPELSVRALRALRALTLYSQTHPRRRVNSSTFRVLEDLEVTPLDEWNVKLLDNVHPPKWIDPDARAIKYKMLVIGAGAAGLVTAAASAGVGARVALIEKHLLGGDCLNFGCVPSKALLRCARAVKDAQNGAAFGVRVENVHVDFPAIMERMRRLRAQISPNDSARRFSKELGIDVFIGTAQFVSKNQVIVNNQVLRFSKCCIATGGSAAVPDIPGLRESGFHTNVSIFNLTELPRRMAVFGTGAVGCELAQAFARFGSEVHLFGRSSTVLPKEDKDAGEIVGRAMQEDGVRMHLGIQYERVELRNGARVVQFLRDGVGEAVEVDLILVATGRKPNVNGIGLKKAGVKYDAEEGIAVNDHLQTSNGSIYACGDVCGQYQFTHMADAMARMVVRNALFMGSSKFSALTVPWCTYTEPEVAHVGLYESDLRDANIEFQTFTRKFEEVDRAILDGDTEGYVRVHVRSGTDQIVGATIVASHAGDMISEITLAMTNKIGIGRIANVIHPYPTQAEAIRQLGDAFNRTRLTPFVKVLFRKWLEG